MLKIRFECEITAQDQDSGYFKHQKIESRNIYAFTCDLATALVLINQEAADHAKATEIDKMEEQSELPF